MKHPALPQPSIEGRGLTASLRACAWGAAMLAMMVRAEASPNQADLGEGLGYVRIMRVPEDLPSTRQGTPERNALVLDLRDAATDQSQTRTLLAYVKSQVKAERPSLILLNDGTTPMLREMLMETAWPALITLAPARVKFHPDITVDTSVEEDRSASLALAEGINPAELIQTKQTKDRWDESSLTKDHQDGGSGVGPQPPEPKGKLDEMQTKAFTPKDQVLARAVQIHRGMIALRALPGKPQNR